MAYRYENCHGMALFSWNGVLWRGCSQYGRFGVGCGSWSVVGLVRFFSPGMAMGIGRPRRGGRRSETRRAVRRRGELRVFRVE